MAQNGTDGGSDRTRSLTYARYLDLDRLLGAQHPGSGAHDEMLFIVIHQVSELWLKLCLHELSAARNAVLADDLRPAFKMFARVARALTQLVQGWDVLATMTPADYAAVRPHLGTSSGFQSHQYRMLEAMLGARDPARLRGGEPADRAALAAEFARPGLGEASVALLARRGFDVGDTAAIEAAWAAVYRAPERWWDLYELAEKLVDLEYHVQRWRFGHLKTVERVIGFKRGTGGSSGMTYLAAVLDQRFFPELLAVRTAL